MEIKERGKMEHEHRTSESTSITHSHPGGERHSDEHPLWASRARARDHAVAFVKIYAPQGECEGCGHTLSSHGIAGCTRNIGFATCLCVLHRESVRVYSSEEDRSDGIRG